MPDKPFSRARIGDSQRKFGEAPTLGRVSRTPSTVPKRTTKHRKRVRKKPKRSFPVVAWILIISFVVLMLLVVFLVGHFRAKKKEVTESAILSGAAEASPTTISDGETVNPR